MRFNPIKLNGSNESLLNAKAKKILNQGHFISKSDFFRLEIFLYRVDFDFVEIWFETNTKKVTRIDYFKNKKINPYLKHLDLCSMN